jgi:hypothetical protein
MCASCTRERCKRWHARTTQKPRSGKKLGDRQNYRSRWLALNVRHSSFKISRLRLPWIPAIQFTRPCQPLRPYDSDREVHAWCGVYVFGFRGTEDAPAKGQLAPEHWTKIVVGHAANPRRHALLSDGMCSVLVRKQAPAHAITITERVIPCVLIVKHSES